MSDKLYVNRKGSRASTQRGSRSNIKRRKPQNRYILENESENVSTFTKKLKISHEEYEINVSPTFEYRFIDFLIVFSILSQILVCKTCKTKIKFTDQNKRGLGYKIVVNCEKCCPTIINAVPIIEKHAYDINRRIVFAMRLLGIGLNGITKFCAFMNLPHPIFQSFYDTVVKSISIATAAVREKSTKMAAIEEKRLNEENGQNDGLIVSGDGSWRKRGFSSLFGIATLIGWHTKKVLDVIVKSKYCKTCEFWEKKENTAEYQEWMENHANECQANHEGSSGKMEIDSIVEMFSRSEELHGVKYRYYIGDGDSKTFKGIQNCEPYENFPVFKRECVGHVQKRMGTRLRNLKKNTRGLGGKGKLTGKLIDELSVYYGLAIRRNKDSIEKMRTEIWATLYHKLSTDNQPQHHFCPAGENSWCSYEKAKAKNDVANYKHKPAMHTTVFEAIKPIYEELSTDELLTRCVGGFTQNSNESLNATVWSIAPKSFASSKRIIDIATDLATCYYNDGYRDIMKIMEVLNVAVGPTCYNFCEKADERRITLAERSLTDEAKDARRASLSKRKEADESAEFVEGQLYGAGIAD